MCFAHPRGKKAKGPILSDASLMVKACFQRKSENLTPLVPFQEI